MAASQVFCGRSHTSRQMCGILRTKVQGGGTSEFLKETPVGALVHRTWPCPELASSRAKHAPQEMVQLAVSHAVHGALALERGLLPSMQGIMSPHPPPPRKEGSFHWDVRPPAPRGTYVGRVYTDGARLDGHDARTERDG